MPPWIHMFSSSSITDETAYLCPKRLLSEGTRIVPERVGVCDGSPAQSAHPLSDSNFQMSETLLFAVIPATIYTESSVGGTIGTCAPLPPGWYSSENVLCEP